MKTIGAFEAKTHLPKILERVQSGESFVITRHGEPVAHLVPPPGKALKPDVVEMVKQWRIERQGLTLGGLNVRDLINEGRP